jgi:tetraacyldisaccharide 4'-kinase
VKAPGFWDRPPGLAAALLTPAAWLWTAVGRRQMRQAGWTAPVPVICVGNLTAGGAGKTPVTLALQLWLQQRGIAAHVLSRGYGGTEAGPLAVDPTRHRAGQVGDEPLLLAAAGPTWVARDRRQGAQAAVAAGAQALLLDDGFQSPALVKSLSLLVVDGGVGFGNGRVIPAGPLREPVAGGLARAGGVILIGEDRTGVMRHLPTTMPQLQARLRPDPAMADRLRGRAILGFAGIGRPQKFFDSLTECGAILCESVSFADHHPYTETEVTALLDRAKALNAVPVTTAKDSVRLPPALRDQVTVLPVSLAWADPAALSALLRPLFPAVNDLSDHG